MTLPHRLVWLATVVFGLGIFWMPHRPPMVDLPQHAAQIGLLADVFSGESPWAGILKINFATPYLTTYGLGWLLAHFMPVVTATKLILSCALCAFDVMSVLLRKTLSSDPRLDWLALASFFGFAWKWGFLSFLVAAPIGLLFIWASIRYLTEKKSSRAALLIAVGSVLLISHGLIFIFAWSVGFYMCCWSAYQSRQWVKALWPVVLTAAIFLAYSLFISYVQFGLVSGSDSYGITIWALNPIGRLKELFVYSFDNQSSVLYTIVTCVLILAPLALRCQINIKNQMVWAILVLTLIIFFCAPAYAAKTAFLYQRFAIFLLPAWALIFSKNQITKQSRLTENIIILLMALSVWVPLASHMAEAIRFKRESTDFEIILNRLEPNKRALYLAIDNYSPADRHQNIYLHYGSWYQADKKGFVDFNFAWFPPQMLRFKTDDVTEIRPSFEFQPKTFDWNKHKGDKYDYFIVRSEISVEEKKYFMGAQCMPVLLAQRGAWYVYEKNSCK
jgi:hypothetical protein